MNRTHLVLAVLVAAVLVAFAGPAAGQQAAEKIRVAVVGDSISSVGGWPSRLGKLLGDGYEVKAFAANGLTVLRDVYRSVWTRYEYRHALNYKPNVVLLMFGANAGKPGNWAQKARWAEDYKSLIALYVKLETRPKVYLCLPTVVTKDAYGVSADLVNKEVVPGVKKVAEEAGVGAIDTHTPLKDKAGAIGGDGIYPTELGYEIIARVVYTALTGKEAPPLPEIKKPEKPAEKPAAAEEKPTTQPAGPGVLTAAVIADTKGDGPDGKANTADDTWQFWFQYDTRGGYGVLGVYTKGPEEVPDGKNVEGWVYSMTADWSPEFEGVWGNTKDGKIHVHPYTHHGFHASLAITYKVPEDGVYNISGGITDVIVFKQPPHDGVIWIVEVLTDGKAASGKELGRGQPIGDTNEKDATTFSIEKASLKKGELVRFVIDPNRWWGTDMTRIDSFKVQKAK